MADATSTTSRSFTITRIFDASRELVFKAWTEPEQIARWWGPHRFTTPLETITVDPRPGGVFRLTMIFDLDGSEHPVSAVFREFVEPERLVLAVPAEENRRLPIDNESLVIVDFIDLGGRTEVKMCQTGLRPEVFDSAFQGWSEQLERLVGLLSGS
jgi:uncharacterized protein YndB with AHSA1/START domain